MYGSFFCTFFPASVDIVGFSLSPYSISNCLAIKIFVCANNKTYFKLNMHGVIPMRNFNWLSKIIFKTYPHYREQFAKAILINFMHNMGSRQSGNYPIFEKNYEINFKFENLKIHTFDQFQRKTLRIRVFLLQTKYSINY